jgi:hypothetical protein
LLTSTDKMLLIRWDNTETWAELKVDFLESNMEICYLEDGVEKRLDFKTTVA